MIYSVDKPYKPTGGLRVLGGNLSPDFSAILKLAGVEGGLENNIFRGKARIWRVSPTFGKPSRLNFALSVAVFAMPVPSAYYQIRAY